MQSYQPNLLLILYTETYSQSTIPIIGETREIVDGCPIDYWITEKGKHEKGGQTEIIKT